MHGVGGIRRRRGWIAAAVALVAVLLGACTSTAADPQATSPASRTISTTLDPPTVASSPSSTAPSTTARPPTSATSSSTAGRVSAQRGQLTPEGLWWAVDSVAPISEQSLANVRGWYRGSPRPVVWGRYLNGSFGLRTGELAFARAHRIGVYLIIPDRNCSVCAGGGDVCGQDRTAAQADQDARAAVRAAVARHIPAHATLFKDIEQVGTCSGELTGDYLLAWYKVVRGTKYRPGFYGNTNRQFYDFPRAYCAAQRRNPAFTKDVPLAQDEPEPQIDPDRGEIGPSNAPRFAPYYPHCISRSAVNIWQYAESGRSANSTDTDEVRPGTPGILTPDGRVT